MARQIHSDTDATKPVIIALTASAYTEDRCKALASDVPAGLITAIQSALQDGDTDQLLTLADTLAGENALAAQQLRRMVEEYDYDAVEQWLLRA